MRINLSSFRTVALTCVFGFLFSTGVCVVTVLESDLSVLPWGDRVGGPRQILAEDISDWPDEGAEGPAAAQIPVASAVGEQHYLKSCATCHGVGGQGMPHQGPGLLDSAFVAGADDAALAAFLKRGRAPTDRGSVMRLYMPPRGGNPSLTDDDLNKIVKHVRTLRRPAGHVDTTAALPPG